MEGTAKTTIELDKDLLQEAMDLSGEKTIKATVDMALHEYVKSKKNKQLLVMEGQVEFDSEYDYKSERKKW